MSSSLQDEITFGTENLDYTCNTKANKPKAKTKLVEHSF